MTVPALLEQFNLPMSCRHDFSIIIQTMPESHPVRSRLLQRAELRSIVPQKKN